MEDGCLRAWIGLGGNRGDVAAALWSARRALGALSRAPLWSSPLYETAPWGLVDQAPFLNQVVGLMPRHGPRATLRALQSIEGAAGRRSGPRWGPRPLDLDILCWPAPVWSDAELTVPHPRLADRRFVLAPWAAVAPQMVVRGTGCTVAHLLATCPDGSWARRCSG